MRAVKDKQSIRYVGFASGPGGSRLLEFSFETPSHERSSMTFDIAAVFFSGDDRIMVQEAAGICYAKLKDILDAELSVPGRCLITGNDIVHYRQVPLARQRAARSTVPYPGIGG